MELNARQRVLFYEDLSNQGIELEDDFDEDVKSEDLKSIEDRGRRRATDRSRGHGGVFTV